MMMQQNICIEFKSIHSRFLALKCQLCAGLLSSLDFSNLRTGVEADEKLRKEEKLAKFKDECSEIHPGLFVGGLEVAKNKALLEQMGITHIVNCVTSLLPNQFPNDYCYLNYDFPGTRFPFAIATDFETGEQMMLRKDISFLNLYSRMWFLNLNLRFMHRTCTK